MADFQPEPIITINGKKLTDAQAMTVRVAVSNFALQLSDADFRAELGPIADGYRARAAEVERMLVEVVPRG